ncbi:M56 family metallopeptidase [Streptacidiphilus sp. ASG 303]|uniref:M56 family metallopeptidase n=1 Tax=Streptacidiphilus sp. ASG 303 TaxID=2896847 RepID=UPI001E387A1C|nr:M56 family metallopeptidase [Streptacidiphilus sp. ASG 303]MCD0483810.1 M56 family metallopeptidase [Streptacidiphilus sp. ASG 303]
MTALLGLMLLCLLLSTAMPRLLVRATWPEREPVLALGVWQCLVVSVLLCCGLGLVLAASAAVPAVREALFRSAPRQVVDAYGFADAGLWGAAAALLLAYGGLHTAVALAREVRAARAARSLRQAELARLAPDLPPGAGAGGDGARERLVVLESLQPEAWSLPGPAARLVVTTGALRRLSDRELAAVLDHERGHVRARHHWLLQCGEALAAGFPGVAVFAAFRDEVGRLVELAADDAASRRHGRLATALALVELNSGRGVFGTCPAQRAEVPRRVDRLLAGEPRLPVRHRVRLTAAGLTALAVPLLLALAPGLHALL